LNKGNKLKKIDLSGVPEGHRLKPRVTALPEGPIREQTSCWHGEVGGPAVLDFSRGPFFAQERSPSAAVQVMDHDPQ